MSGIVAVIPAFNAATSIEQIIRGTTRYVHSVVVVDDGSGDGTGDVARREGAVVLTHGVNRGKGAALMTGFDWALEHGADGVLTLDADGQHLPDQIPKIIEAREKSSADLVIGSRAHLFGAMLAARRLANRFSAWSIAWASGTGVTDSQSGFRYYSARLLRSIPLRTRGFDLESEVIVRAGRRGFRVVDTPIELGFVDGVSTSHYRPLADTFRIVWTVFRARFLWR